MKRLGRRPTGNIEFSKQWFPTVEALYKAKLNSLLALASRHLYQKDQAMDVVHNALVKSLIYFNKNPTKKVREQVVHLEILRACKRANRYCVEVPSGSMNYDPTESND